VDTILPSVLAVSILVLASLLLGRSGFNSFNVLGEAFHDAEDRAVERLRSDITITSIQEDPSMSGTTDVPVLFSATTDAADFVQTSDGQLTVFMVNQDTNSWIRTDDIKVTVYTAVGSTVYDFTGITSPSSTHTAEDGEIDVTDAVIVNGTFGARRNTISGWNSWAEASTGNYSNLVGSNDAYYQTPNPGNGDNAAMIFEFYIAEAPATITQIDIQVEGGRNAAADFWFLYLWNYSTSTYAVCCSDVDVTVRNDGATPIVDFSRMDVVFQYTTGGGSVLNKYVDFTTDTTPQPAPSWLPISVNDDVIDPGILNTGESLAIRARLFPAVGTGTSNWLQVTTELGISASLFFTN
jgi:hypothetical protein